MSILRFVKCEMCKNTFQLPLVSSLAPYELPALWLTLYEGNSANHEGKHFCSEECLRQYFQIATMPQKTELPSLDEDDDLPPDEFLPFRGKCLPDGRVVSLADGAIYIPEPQENPDCKARRFLLADGETAEFTDGVKWGDGKVSIEAKNQNEIWTYDAWDDLKKANQGSGVQWIDQEVSK
jgi:hypothetical protein